MRLGLVGNSDYEGLGEVMRRLRSLVPQYDLTLVCEPALVPHLAGCETLDEHGPLDAMLSLGGDGILGVNLGRLGFLTSCDANGLEDGVRRLATGDYHAEPRMALRAAAVDASGTEQMCWRSLNDVVLHKGGFARVVRFAVWVDGEPVGAFGADGVVVSTPTGSTAYSLSAGGPIVVPTVESIVLTAVSPHTLAIRPLVLPPTAELHLTADGSSELLVTIDGQVGTTFRGSETLVVRRAETPVMIARFADDGFFSRLRQKMGWGGLSERDDRGGDLLAGPPGRPTPAAQPAVPAPPNPLGSSRASVDGVSSATS
jgi:NAD+ kinase